MARRKSLSHFNAVNLILLLGLAWPGTLSAQAPTSGDFDLPFPNGATGIFIKSAARKPLTPDIVTVRFWGNLPDQQLARLDPRGVAPPTATDPRAAEVDMFQYRIPNSGFPASANNLKGVPQYVRAFGGGRPTQLAGAFCFPTVFVGVTFGQIAGGAGGQSFWAAPTNPNMTVGAHRPVQQDLTFDQIGLLRVPPRFSQPPTFPYNRWGIEQ